MAKLDGIAVASVSAGVILLWSGIQNRSITSTIQDLVKGTKPLPGPAQTLVATSTGNVQGTVSAPIAGGTALTVP